MAQAFAAYDCKCGTYSELVLAQFSGKDDNNIVDKASISSGSCPGMSLKLSADATQILLSGTPTKPGTYKLTVAFEMRDGQPGSTDATVNVAAVQPTVQASASTTAPKKDDNFQLKLSLTGGAPYEVTLYTNTSNSTSGGAAGTTWTFESDSQNVTVGTKGYGEQRPDLLLLPHGEEQRRYRDVKRGSRHESVLHHRHAVAVSFSGR